MSGEKPSATMSMLKHALVFVMFILAAQEAYRIRLYAIKVYGRVIHEFDPWFNFRATQYLADNGLKKFFKWFDYESWYPLGRPVGTTIYPGMQITSVLVWKLLKQPFWQQYFGFNPEMSLNDVCVYVPTWFGSIASVAIGLLTREVSGSYLAGGFASLIMAIIPAHIIRSVGGAFDNESVAMSAMCLTFFLWCRALRTPKSWWIGIPAGLAYFYMVAAWGGFIFVGNMVATHAALLVGLGYFSPSLHKAYTLWYIVGTLGAVQVPVVSMTPFKSLEQLGLLAVFFLLHLVAVAEYLGKRKGLTWQRDRDAMLKLRMTVFAAAGAVAVLLIATIVPSDYFGPISVRVRSLFIKHTRTGNPLVDSVAEHQPVSAQAYWLYLNYVYYLAPVGLVVTMFKGAADKARVYHGLQVTKWFIILYAVVGYYFATRMARLIIILGPVASVLAGIALEWGITWALEQIALLKVKPESVEDAPEPTPATSTPSKGKDKKGEKKSKKSSEKEEHPLAMYGLQTFIPVAEELSAMYSTKVAKALRIVFAVLMLLGGSFCGRLFWEFCDTHAQRVSQPSIMFLARLNNGQEVMINDYQEAYWWLRDNTPQDSRVLAWWDYGYQINGIANRTSLADGNTWTIEHIAFVGRILTSPEKKAWQLARHVADYVLVWAGNQGDDLAKSPHIVRIASSQYPEMCPNDPECRAFGFYQTPQGHAPSPAMAKSMLYKMHSHMRAEGVFVDSRYFKEVYSSKYGLVRIFEVLNTSKESKEWVADPANRVCDHPGSWFCRGQYPPGLPKSAKRRPQRLNKVEADRAEITADE